MPFYNNNRGRGGGKFNFKRNFSTFNNNTRFHNESNNSGRDNTYEAGYSQPGPSYRGKAPRGSRNAGNPPPNKVTNISTVHSDPLNDVAYLVDPGVTMLPQGRSRFISTSMIGLPGLIETCRLAISARNTNFAKTITPMMLQYYFGHISLARMIKVHILNRFNYNESMERYVDMIASSNFKVPKSILLYNNGVGNTTIPSSRELVYRLPTNFRFIPRNNQGELVAFNSWTVYP